MDISDIRVSVVGDTDLSFDSIEVNSNGCNSYHIHAWGSYTGEPILGEYVVEIRDSSDQTTSYTVGTLEDYPRSAPNLTHPTHCDLLTNQTPTFTWDAYGFTYDGTPLSVQDYSLGLEINSGDWYGLNLPGGKRAKDMEIMSGGIMMLSKMSYYPRCL